jgi:hypothetical protein
MGIGDTMNNFNFGEVLTRAWKNIWKHKVLWVFGILASCARGGGGSGGGGSRDYQTSPGGDMPFSGGQIERIANQVGQYIQQNLWLIIAVGLTLILLSFILSFILYALGMMGRIGLIKGTYKIENGAESLSFGEIWNESLPYFWRIFGVNFLISIAFLVIFIPLVLFGVITFGFGFICVIPLLCILIPISWVIAVVLEQAQIAIVLEDLNMLDGFKRGWNIVKSNAVPMIIMVFILGIGGAIISVIVALPMIVAFIPVLMGMETLRESLTPLYISLACCAVYVPVLILFNGVLTAYIQSVWTLTYMKLAQPKEDAPIIITEANA